VLSESVKRQVERTALSVGGQRRTLRGRITRVLRHATTGQIIFFELKHWRRYSHAMIDPVFYARLVETGQVHLIQPGRLITAVGQDRIGGIETESLARHWTAWFYPRER
jgi:hypothetical protein